MGIMGRFWGKSEESVGQQGVGRGYMGERRDVSWVRRRVKWRC